MSLQRSEMEIFVDSKLPSDSNLVLFLQHFSYNTKIMSKDPVQFVDELESRLAKRKRPVPSPRPLANMSPSVVEEQCHDMMPGAIFISYTNEDTKVALNLEKGLDELGLDIWIDKKGLEAGDEYLQKIRRNIKKCSYFIPLISKQSISRAEGFFIREWKWAIERMESIADSVPFVLPVVIDNTDAYTEAVPEAFRKAQWSNLPGGNITPEFRTKIVQLIREYRKRARSGI